MSFNALEDKVILQLDEVEEKTESGLFIPDGATEMSNIGTVVAVGPGRTAMDGSIIPTGISVGDRVMFAKRSAQKIEIDEQEYLVFLVEHILAIVEA